MSNFAKIAYCPKCEKATDHTFLDLRGFERSKNGSYWKMICGLCGFSRFEDEDLDSKHKE